MSILFSNATRLALVRELLRDKDTVRPYWSDAQVNLFLAEQLVNHHALIPGRAESQSVAYLITDRTKDFSLSVPPTALVSATVGGRRLSWRPYYEVRWLQEYEGRTETTDGGQIYGMTFTGFPPLMLASERNLSVAVYPMSGQTVTLTTHVFVGEEPTTPGADHYQDRFVYEHYKICRAAAYEMAKLMGWSEAELKALQLVDRLFGDAGLGLRRIYEAPQTPMVEDLRGVISGGTG